MRTKIRILFKDADFKGCIFFSARKDERCLGFVEV